MPFDPKKLDNFPDKPGVYLMKNGEGQVLYVGKANSLRQRVKQYFTKRGDGRLIVPYLIAKVEQIDVVLVTSEKEALLLENTLIKQHKPQYNALLKDDKNYIALKIAKHSWPRIDLVRYRGKPKADGLYFGPYAHAGSARKTLDLLHRLFPLRQCSDQEFVRRTRPCLLYDIKKCVAPCVRLCTQEEYKSLVDRAIRFLRGQNKEIIKELYQEMETYASQLEFEKAGERLQIIRHIEKTMEGQLVDKPLGGDADVVGIFREAEESVLAVMFFRSGRLMGVRHYHFHAILEDDSELIASFLLQRYEGIQEWPQEILIPVAIKEVKMIEEVLSEKSGRKIALIVPQRGEKFKLLDLARLNAESFFRKEKDEGEIREKILLEMQERLHLTRYPRSIECFDISTISGSETVAAMVAFKEGKKEASRYRKYTIRSVDVSDDYGAMREVLLRRFKRAQEENDYPDLLIVDGGKGHLNQALSVMKELNIIVVDVVALAKEEGRHDRGQTLEKVFIPGIKDPIVFKKHAGILFLLQRIRDEAHRFAITFHRKRREKTVIRSALDDIPGIGVKKRQKLLQALGSVKRIKEATLEDLIKVPGISQKDAEAIMHYLRQLDFRPLA